MKNTIRTTTEGRTTFSYKAPEALSVMLIGGFTNWQSKPISLRKRPDGVWQITLELAPGTYSYSFLVDDKWRQDGEYKLRVPPRHFAVCGK